MIGSEFARWINPVLKALSELGGSARPRKVVEVVALNERVTGEVLGQVNAAGGRRFPNQVHWARFYLAEAGLIDRSQHGIWRLTPKGKMVGQIEEAVIKTIIEEIQERARSGKVVRPRPLREPHKAVMKRPMASPYVSDLIEILRPHRKGIARRIVMDMLETNRRKKGLPIPKNFAQVVQAVFNHHTSQSMVFKKKNAPAEDDLFYSPLGKHSGIWAVHTDRAAEWLKAKEREQ